MNPRKFQIYKHRRVSGTNKEKSSEFGLAGQTDSVDSPRFIQSLVTKKKDQALIQTSKDTGNPWVSCKSGCAFDLDNGKYIWKLNSVDKRQIASLTKIMTCWVVIQFIRQRQIVPQDEYLTVSKKAADTGGTSAELQQGDVVSIWDLLHGLMLPSGNDAALCLAQGIGKFIGDGKKAGTDAFIDEMNRMACKYQMVNTTYANPHGLTNKHHKSTSEDQILLVREVVRDQIFCKLIEKKIYFCNVQEKDGWNRQIFWQTTNKLLHQSGFSGVKTGATPQAGPCLASWYRKDGYDVIIVTLSSKTQDDRFQDSISIIEWIRNRQEYSQNQEYG